MTDRTLLNGIDGGRDGHLVDEHTALSRAWSRIADACDVSADEPGLSPESVSSLRACARDARLASGGPLLRPAEAS